jgi:undecaprenyl-diphosphatase
MIDFLDQIDRHIFLFLNGFHSPFWDLIMWNISKTEIWLPLYGIVLFFIFRTYKWKGLITFFALLLLVLVSDQGSVHLFKNVFQRLRPCHQPELAGLVHLVNGKCGGQFGFISSHASNTFAFAMFVSFFFMNKPLAWFIFGWAAIVSYSRIYLGVHYPFDIIGGAIYGILAGYVVFKFHQLAFAKYWKIKKPG